jgi:hypothetical protein
MTRDDIIRRDVIQQLMCYGVLDFGAIASRYGIDFRQYFSLELANLEQLVADGLAAFTAPGLRVLPGGPPAVAAPRHGVRRLSSGPAGGRPALSPRPFEPFFAGPQRFRFALDFDQGDPLPPVAPFAPTRGRPRPPLE